MKGLMNFFTSEEEEETVDTEETIEATEEEATKLTRYEAGKKNAKIKKTGNTVLVLFEPRSLNDAYEIANHLMNNKAAVVNMHRLDATTARRVCDFLIGVVYALHGEKVLVGDNVHLFTPNSVDVDGTIDLNTQNEEE